MRGFAFAAAGGCTYRLAALFLIGKHRFVSLLRPKKVRQIFKANRRKEYSSDHAGFYTPVTVKSFMLPK